ncbi:MAG: DUF4332 domain-containing protein [Hyphomicrobiaceae bacterium]|nr:DUF4332 domain-containing protein [Hyphomicrobiaceae bacterium]
MSLLYRVLYAIHARGTHHKLALDGLAQLGGAEAQSWRRLFLKHAEAFMAGAKEPDDVFKDFKNHVLHPRDGFWGGAPAAARRWYGELVGALSREDWSAAARAAGILSHYVTDPVHPFHTGQTEAEGSIHRAFEWSTAKSYDDLKAAAAGGAIAIPVSNGPEWLEDMLRAAALTANGYYEKLIAHYDINRGVVDPPAGIDAVARPIVGRLILTASALFSSVLERAIAEAAVRPPEVTLTLDTVLAALQIPKKVLINRLADRADRAEVESMYDELRATGTVEHALPADDKLIRSLHRVEVLERAPSAPMSATGEAATVRIGTAPPLPRQALAAPLLPIGTDVRKHPFQVMPLAPLATSPASAGLQSPAALVPTAVLPESVGDAPAAATAPVGTATAASPAPSSTLATKVPAARPEPVMAQEQAPARQAIASVTPLPERPARGTSLRPRLAVGDDVVDAPSIGPRMAERLHPLGVLTVQDLLAESPSGLAQALRVAGVTADTVADWQAQAQLVCKVPGLTGTGAQLLVGAGFRDVTAVATAEPDALCSALLAYAGSDKGRRILRDGEPPNIERIRLWAEQARLVAAA